jgi:hypothetical protein
MFADLYVQALARADDAERDIGSESARLIRDQASAIGLKAERRKARIPLIERELRAARRRPGRGDD